MVTLRPWTNALLVGAMAAAAGVLLAGCGSLRVESGGRSAGPSFGLTAGATAGPLSAEQPVGNPSGGPAADQGHATQAVVTQQLSSVARGDRVVAVALGAGHYDGASYDQAGHISFWSYGAGGWSRAGTSTYPFSVALQPVDATTTGALLPGMGHATFIVDGTFTIDHADNSVAFTANGNGTWGVIKGRADGSLVPSGSPVNGDGIGLENGFYVANGQLETADCSRTLPVVSCGGNSRVLKYWVWHDGAFVLVHTAGLAN